MFEKRSSSEITRMYSCLLTNSIVMTVLMEFLGKKDEELTDNSGSNCHDLSSKTSIDSKEKKLREYSTRRTRYIRVH